MNELLKFADQAAQKLDEVSEANINRQFNNVRQQILDVRTGIFTRAKILNYFTNSQTSFVQTSQESGTMMPTDDYTYISWKALERAGFEDKPGFSATLPLQIDENGNRILTIVHQNAWDKSMQLVEVNTKGADPQQETTTVTLYSDKDEDSSKYKIDDNAEIENAPANEKLRLNLDYYRELKNRINLAMKSGGKPIFLYDNDPRRSGTYLDQAGIPHNISRLEMELIGDVVREEYGCSQTNSAGPFYVQLDWPKPTAKKDKGLTVDQSWHTTNVEGLLFMKREFTISEYCIDEDGQEHEQYYNVEAYYAQGPNSDQIEE